MTISAKREKLYDYIRDADDEKADALYLILRGDVEHEGDLLDNKDFIAELDERTRRYEAGIDCCYSVDEVRESLKQLKASRVKI